MLASSVTSAIVPTGSPFGALSVKRAYPGVAKFALISVPAGSPGASVALSGVKLAAS